MRTASQSPRMNAHCERVIGTLRREVLDHLLILNEAHARRVLDTYACHYNGHRPHQARQQRPPLYDDRAVPRPNVRTMQPILRTRVLGGLINEYRDTA
ncbi:integrase core domain-containing protein [Streptomyces sp. NPDC005970]|uniref:integrase core domain-containing protein n=1 Tax=Streptomyces sp. NPDC005970 TaxID=3156723 RepID=UPI0033DD53B1